MAEGKTKIYLAERNTAVDEIFAGSLKRVTVFGEEQDYRSYVESDILISVKDNGALVMSNMNNESIIYLYPEQLPHLKKALDIALKRCGL